MSVEDQSMTALPNILLGARSDGQRAGHSSTECLDPWRYTVLVAEDNPVNQTVLSHGLCRGGHTVVLVSDGLQAVLACRESIYDAVLMDLHMPEMDGFEATRLIREWERGTGRYTPILALTASSEPCVEQRCIAAGMDAFLRKPTKASSLLAQIDRVIRVRRSTSRQPVATQTARPVRSEGAI